MPRKGVGQKVKVAPGQTYGKGVAQEESQQAIPLHREPTAAPPMTPGRPLTLSKGKTQHHGFLPFCH